MTQLISVILLSRFCIVFDSVLIINHVNLKKNSINHNIVKKFGIAISKFCVCQNGVNQYNPLNCGSCGFQYSFRRLLRSFTMQCKHSQLFCRIVDIQGSCCFCHFTTRTVKIYRQLLRTLFISPCFLSYCIVWFMGKLCQARIKTDLTFLDSGPLLYLQQSYVPEALFYALKNVKGSNFFPKFASLLISSIVISKSALRCAP